MNNFVENSSGSHVELRHVIFPNTLMIRQMRDHLPCRAYRVSAHASSSYHKCIWEFFCVEMKSLNISSNLGCCLFSGTKIAIKIRLAKKTARKMHSRWYFMKIMPGLSSSASWAGTSLSGPTLRMNFMLSFVPDFLYCLLNISVLKQIIAEYLEGAI